MPGPRGEDCATCYFGDPNEQPAGLYLCRVNQVGGQPMTTRAGKRLWERTRGGIDWCGRWADRDAPAQGTAAMGSFVVPAGSVFGVTDPVNWTVLNPPGMAAGQLMHNCTFDAGALLVDIPGIFDPSTVFGIAYSGFGALTFPTANKYLEVTIGDPVSVQPYSADAIIKIQPSKQEADLPDDFALGNPAALGAQTLGACIIVRGTADDLVWDSCIFGLTNRVL